MQGRGVWHVGGAWLCAAAALAADTPGPVLAADADRPLPPVAFGISAQRLREHTRILSSDEFEGRAPHTAGEEKTIAYLIDQFRQLGLSPGNPDGTYVQRVGLVGITSEPSLRISVNGQSLQFEALNDFLGPTAREEERIEVAGSEVIFAGCGAVDQALDWDDFANVDLRGKTVVVLVDDPPAPAGSEERLDPRVYGPQARKYFDRWHYKYDLASARGAAACLIVHEQNSVGYTFPVLASYRGRENIELRAPDRVAGRVALEGWLTWPATQRLFTAAGADFESLRAAARRPGFRAQSLGALASFTIDSRQRPMDSRNVVALLPGTDPLRRAEHVIVSAHWDHLGRNDRLAGDQIFNGAGDNASGVAAMLEMARALQALPAAQRPARSVLFLALTAEENGLLGSRYYTRHPLVPLSQTLAAINVDGVNQFSPTSDLEVIGFGATSIDDLAAAIARERGRELHGEFPPERGGFFRSDQFEFARAGVPAFHVKRGRDFVGLPEGAGRQLVHDYVTHDYHRVSDELKPNWSFEGAAHDTEFLVRLALAVANSPDWPVWRAGNDFKRAREATLRDARSGGPAGPNRKP